MATDTRAVALRALRDELTPHHRRLVAHVEAAERELAAMVEIEARHAARSGVSADELEGELPDVRGPLRRAIVEHRALTARIRALAPPVAPGLFRRWF